MKAIRRLGFGELRMHLMHSLFCGTAQGALSIHVRGTLDIDRLRWAVDVVKQRHEMLNVAIVEKDGEFFFTRRPDIDVSDVSLRPCGDSDQEWLKVLQDENAILLDTERQLWRVAIVPYSGSEPRFDIIVVMHHAVMDAYGTDMFLDEVLTLVSGGTLVSVTNDMPAPVPPAAETACALKCSWEKFTASQREIAQKTMEGIPPKHCVDAALSDRRTVVRTFKMSSNQLRVVSAFCTEQGVSFNSYVSAALLAAVRAESPERDRFALYTAVSLRRLCQGIRDEDFGCYLSVVPTFHRLPSLEIAIDELAKEHQAALHASFLSYAKPPVDYVMKDVREGMERLKGIRSFINDIGFTYAESKLRSSYGELRLLHSYVIAGRSLGNVALILHGLKFGDEVFFTMSHTEPLQDRVWAASVTTTLSRAIESPPPGPRVWAQSVVS